MNIVALALGPRWVSPDARLVVVARALRTFGYGCTSVLLGQMLVEDGDPPARIGILLAVAATGSVVASILMGLYADRFGRRSSLLLSAGLMTWLLARGTGAKLLESTIGERRPGYADYVRRTSGFLPLPPRRPAHDTQETR